MATSQSLIFHVFYQVLYIVLLIKILTASNELSHAEIKKKKINRKKKPEDIDDPTLLSEHRTRNCKVTILEPEHFHFTHHEVLSSS